MSLISLKHIPLKQASGKKVTTYTKHDGEYCEMEMLGNGRIFFMVKTVVHSRFFSSQTISPLATWLDEQMESSLGMFWGLDVYACSGEQENLGSKCAVCFLSLLNPTLGSFHKAFY